jgi:hypothetical protein
MPSSTTTPQLAQRTSENPPKTTWHMSSTVSPEETAPRSRPNQWAPPGGVYPTLLPVPDDRVHAIHDGVKNNHTLAYSAVGEAFEIGPEDVPAKPEDLEFAKVFWGLARGLLQEGEVGVHGIDVNEGGGGTGGRVEGHGFGEAGEG